MNTRLPHEELEKKANDLIGMISGFGIYRNDALRISQLMTDKIKNMNEEQFISKGQDILNFVALMQNMKNGKAND